MSPERLANLVRDELRDHLHASERRRILELVLVECIAELDGDLQRSGLVDMVPRRERDQLVSCRQALAAARAALQAPDVGAIETNTWSHWP